jgi:hypothetical protein
MDHALMVSTARMLTLASALAFSWSAASAQTVGGNVGSGDTRGSFGASLSGDSFHGESTANEPSGTTHSGSLSFGQSSGSTTASIGTIDNTRTNFSSAYNSDQSTGSVAVGSGETSATFGLGSLPGTALPGTGLPGINPEGATGIAGAIGRLTIDEQRRLARKCIAVLGAPKKYIADQVAVCKVLASL